ncbi:hypothetical protein [Polyangium aurulentum]|uniref:hypothetical protein n=1 Tax=Polyangium aurulentum TaxID=2567896 RepID=UPI0010AED4EC|nr:hypothetical protein [Polyangium aurulentum]UQA63185.1 hypothetical protein E8A73_023055 [Polyangium aurulentum]
MSSTPLTIERYAQIRAEMEAGRLRDEVLARAGVTMGAWVAEPRTWLQKMGAEFERGRFELTNRYTQAFFERQKALEAASRNRADVQGAKVEAHASLCAKLALAPNDAEQIFAKYGLASPEKRKAVDEAWKERLRSDPKLYEQWQQLYRMFYARWQEPPPRRG